MQIPIIRRSALAVQRNVMGFLIFLFSFEKLWKKIKKIIKKFFKKSYEFEIRPRRHHLGYSLVAISGGMGLYPKSDLRNFGELHIKKFIKYGKKWRKPLFNLHSSRYCGYLNSYPKTRNSGTPRSITPLSGYY